MQLLKCKMGIHPWHTWWFRWPDNHHWEFDYKLTNKDIIERVRKFGTHVKSQRSLTAYIRTCDNIQDINFTAAITVPEKCHIINVVKFDPQTGELTPICHKVGKYYYGPPQPGYYTE